MALDTTGSLLTLVNASTDRTSLLPLYSARGLTQTWQAIDSAMVQARTVNAELVNLAVPRFRKLRTVISATNVRPPSRDDIWPGLVVEVGCVFVLNYPTVGGVPSRAAVAGSQFIEGDFTFYRPLLTCMIGKPTGSFEEWEAGYSWSIPMEEV